MCLPRNSPNYLSQPDHYKRGVSCSQPLKHLSDFVYRRRLFHLVVSAMYGTISHSAGLPSNKARSRLGPKASVLSVAACHSARGEIAPQLASVTRACMYSRIPEDLETACMISNNVEDHHTRTARRYTDGECLIILDTPTILWLVTHQS